LTIPHRNRLRPERLPDQSRALDGLAGLYQFAVRLAGKHHLRQSRNNERVNDSEQHGRHKRHPDRDEKIFFHVVLTPDRSV
jgi:hypothetical protein